MYYTLIDKIVVPCDMWTWAKMNEGNISRVDETTIGDIYISTVFIGLSMVNWSNKPNNHPLVFETMIFGGELDGYQERYSTWGEAEEGHKRAVGKVNRLLEGQNILKELNNGKDRSS